jgi:hypothetical protein
MHFETIMPLLAFVALLLSMISLIGAVRKAKRSANLRNAGGFFLTFLALMILPQFFRPYFDPAKREVAAREKDSQALFEAAKCLSDLECISEKNRSELTTQCQMEIERAAKYDHKWTNSWGERKFQTQYWKNQKKAVAIYQGKTLRMQNAFGVWVPVVYDCTFDHKNRVALGVNVLQP